MNKPRLEEYGSHKLYIHDLKKYVVQLEQENNDLKARLFNDILVSDRYKKAFYKACDVLSKERVHQVIEGKYKLVGDASDWVRYLLTKGEEKENNE